MRLADILKQERIELGLTQEEVGEQLFVTRQTVSNWENGKTLPDIDSLIDLATFYHLSLDTILLKGSEIVDDIKKKEKLMRIYKWTIVPSIITVLLLFLMYRAIVENNMLNLAVISALLFLNAASFIFLESQMNEVNGKPLSTWSKKRVISFGLIILLGALLGFFSAIYL